MYHKSLSIPLSLSSSFTSASNPTSPANPLHHPDYISLTRLLTRLTHYILIGDLSTPRNNLQNLRQSPYHRTRTLSDVEYARTLLLRLEHSAQAIKIQSQKRALLKDLTDKRRLIKRLRVRIEELGKEGEGEAEKINTDDNEYTEDYFGGLRHQSQEKTDRLRNKAPDLEALSKPQHRSVLSTPSPPPPSESPRPSSPNQTLRRRRGPQKQPPQPLSSLAAEHSPSSPHSSAPKPPNLSTARALESASTTQDSLSDSLVTMARQLHQQSKAMSASLDSDATLLSRATEGLEKSHGGMAATGKQMGMLSRMSEGRGLWGRMLMYAWIFGLWVLLVLLVFVGPKLRR